MPGLNAPIIQVKAAAYTAVPGDLVLADATSAAFTVTLPTAANGVARGPITVKKTDATANVVTVDGAGSETIDGATTYTLAARYDTVTIVSDGTGWYVQNGTSTLFAPAWVPLFPGLVRSAGGPISPSFGSRAKFIPVQVTHRIAVNRVLANVTAQSGNIDVGVYDNDGTGGGPGTRLAAAGSTACPATGARSVTIASTTLTPGIYFVAIAADNTTAAVESGATGGDYTGIGALVGTLYLQDSAFPLPASAAATVTATIIPLITVGAA